MAQSTHGRSDTMSDLKDKASDQIRRAADTAEGVASRVADQGRQAAEGVQDVAGNMKGALDKSIKDQPMATLAVAAAVGLSSARSGRRKPRGPAMFRGLINDAKSAASSLVLKYVARASVAIPFVIALGFALAALTVWLVNQYGYVTGYLLMAGGLAAIGVIAALVVSFKEHEEEVAEEAAEAG